MISILILHLSYDKHPHITSLWSASSSHISHMISILISHLSYDQHLHLTSLLWSESSSHISMISILILHLSYDQHPHLTSVVTFPSWRHQIETQTWVHCIISSCRVTCLICWSICILCCMCINVLPWQQVGNNTDCWWASLSCIVALQPDSWSQSPCTMEHGSI